MAGFLGEGYLWVKALHAISIIAWMAGLFYLPRLFVYHTQVAVGTEQSELFKVMERKLYRFIMNPAMMASWLFGLLLMVNLEAWSEGWFHVKLTCVILMQGFHHVCAKWMKNFARDDNQKSEKFFRLANEVPTILMIVIVILVIVKPF